jgi:hypothetical protein
MPGGYVIGSLPPHHVRGDLSAVIGDDTDGDTTAL